MSWLWNLPRRARAGPGSHATSCESADCGTTFPPGLCGGVDVRVVLGLTITEADRPGGLASIGEALTPT